MSIYNNVAYGLRVHRMNHKLDMDIVVRRYLELAGLWEEVKDRLHAPAVELSIGQQQRLCLARGLAVGARNFIVRRAHFGSGSNFRHPY